MFSSIIAGNCLYHLVDYGLSDFLALETLKHYGLSDFLALETLKHGTNSVNYIGIRLLGGDPTHGGKAAGSTSQWSDDDTVYNYFYLFKDKSFSLTAKYSQILHIYLLELIVNSKFFAPRLHDFLSGYNFW